MIGVERDGEMELTAEYRGKIREIDGNCTDQTKAEDVVIEVICAERDGREIH